MRQRFLALLLSLSVCAVYVQALQAQTASSGNSDYDKQYSLFASPGVGGQINNGAGFHLWRNQLDVGVRNFVYSGEAEKTDDKQTPPSTNKPDSKPAEDLSKWPSLILAFEGGSGRSSPPNSSPTAYGGIKIGGAGVILDLGYDRIPSHNGYSTEVSGMLPVFRLPGLQKDETRNYLRIYAEPGLGYRAGGGVGAYASAKVMMVLFSDRRLTSSPTKWSPFIEFQRRIALQPGQRGDTRVTVGIMAATCEHCGWQ